MPGYHLLRRAGHGGSLTAGLIPSPFVLPRTPADVTITASPEIVHATSKIFVTSTITETKVLTIPTPSVSIKTIEQFKTIPEYVTVTPKLLPRDDTTVTITPPTVYKTTVIKITDVVTQWRTVKSIIASISYGTTTVEKPMTVSTTITQHRGQFGLPPSAGAKQSSTQTRTVLPLPSGTAQGSTTANDATRCGNSHRLRWLHIAVAFVLGALLMLFLLRAWALFRRWRAKRTGKSYIDRKPLFKRTGVVGDIPLERVEVDQGNPVMSNVMETTASVYEAPSRPPVIRESLSHPPPAYAPSDAALPEAHRDEHGFWTDVKV